MFKVRQNISQRGPRRHVFQWMNVKDYQHDNNRKKIINATINNAINESSYDYIKRKLDNGAPFEVRWKESDCVAASVLKHLKSYAKLEWTEKGRALRHYVFINENRLYYLWAKAIRKVTVLSCRLRKTHPLTSERNVSAGVKKAVFFFFLTPIPLPNLNY